MMACIKRCSYQDRYQGRMEHKPAVSFVDSESDAYRANPDCFAPASGHDQALRSEDVVRTYGGADACVLTAVRTETPSSTPTVKPKQRRPGRRGPIRYDHSAQRWVEEPSARQRRASATVHKPARSRARNAVPNGNRIAEGADAKPWSLTPTNVGTSVPGPLPCQARYQVDELSTELRSGAREQLQGICRRTTGTDELEVAGLLLGYRRADRFVVVLAATEAQSCVRTRSGVQWHPQADVERALRDHPDQDVVACWHSHPQMGWSGLSDADLQSAASWRANLGVDAFGFCLLARDTRGNWISIRSFVAGPTIRAPISCRRPS